MPTEVIMPKVDMDQEIATIISWEKKEGDLVKQDEVLLTVETEKVAIDVTSPATGILAAIKYQEGDVVPVTTVIAQILAPGETLPDLAGKGADPPESSAVSQDSIVDGHASGIPQTLDVTKEGATEQEPEHPSAGVLGKIAATPAARRVSEETGVPLSSVSGSGPFGRIQAEDVRKITTKPVESSAGRQADVIPLVDMRARIAQRLQASFQTAPHLSETVEADVSHLEGTKQHLNEIATEKKAVKVSLTAILVKLVAWALERNPYINSSLSDDKIYLWKEVNIGVATALDNGLIVPVVHNANQLSFSEIAEKLNDLTQRARHGRLELGDVQRGTFTISNLGMYGIRQARAVINPPESAILTVGAAVRKPIVIDDMDTVAVRPVISFTLSADHRVIDGVVAARFLSDLVKVVEHPEILLS